MHKSGLILFVLLMFVSIQGKAQKKDFTYYDALTYKLYMDKDYRQLIKIGKEAFNSGLDYYYLRMRIGIALYQQKKYREAAVQFNKAIAFSDNDIVREYLYYANLRGGLPLEAQKVANGMSNALRKRIGLPDNNIVGTGAGMAYMGQTEDFPEGFDFPVNKGEGEQIVPTGFFNMTFALSHKAGKVARMTHMFSYLYKTNDRYSFYDNEQNYDTGFNTNQLEYYLGTGISLGRRWNMIIGGHFSIVGIPEYVESSNRWQGMPGNQLVKTTIWNQDYVLSASVLKNFSRISIEGEIGFMYINGEFKIQPSGILVIYPFANLDLYTQSQFSYLINGDEGDFFQQQKLGFKIAKHLWIEGSYFSGSVSGFTLGNGALLFNGLEDINRMAGGQLIIPGGPKFTMSLGYNNRLQTNYFMPADDVNYKTNNLELNYSLIFISLSWKL